MAQKLDPKELVDFPSRFSGSISPLLIGKRSLSEKLSKTAWRNSGFLPFLQVNSRKCSRSKNLK